MNDNLFQSHIISSILTWVFSIPLITGLIAASIGFLFEKQKGISRIFTIWLVICLIFLSPLRYIILQLFIATAFPFQELSSFLSTFLLAIYIPIVFGILYAIGLGVPFLLIALIAGMKDPVSKIRLFLAGIGAPVIFLTCSFLYYTILPYAAYSTHWLNPTGLVKATNGPAEYVYKYIVEPFTPLEFPHYVNDIGFDKLSSKERLRAHVASMYLSHKKFSYYVYKSYPEYFNKVTNKTKKD